jgi:hypothetical protein
MRTTLFALIIFVAVLFYSSCSTKQGQITIDTEVEVIDFFSFSKTVVDEIPESVIKNKKYIKLDGANEDYFFKGIGKISIVDDRIYILDRRLKKLIIFDTTGTGIGCVGKRGQGPGEYLQITDFSINERGDVYFIDGTLDNDRLFVFDKYRQFVSVKSLSFEADIVHCLPGDKLLFGLSSWNKGKYASRKIVVTNSELDMEQVYGEYDEYIDDSYWISDYTFVNIENNIFYNKPIDNFVYQFSETGSLVKAYFFDFGKKNVPNEDKKDIDGNREKYKNYCCLKNFTIINDKYIFGTLRDELKTKTFVIDRNNRKLYISEEIPTADNSNISGFYDNQIISYIYPGKYDDIQATDFPADVKKHVEDENFVVCLYTLK